MPEDFSLDDTQEEKEQAQENHEDILLPKPLERPSYIHLGKPTEEEERMWIQDVPERKIDYDVKISRFEFKTHALKLDHHVDLIIEMILVGKSFRQISDLMDVPSSSFFTWRKTSAHSTRIEAAMQESSEMDVIRAEEILLEDQTDGNMAEIQRKKELSMYYRWRASKRAPKVFGDKQEVNHTIDTSQPMNEEQFKIFMEMQMKQAQLQLKQGERNGNIEDADIVG